jgi:L-iditol 2-dehydrogenase
LKVVPKGFPMLDTSLIEILPGVIHAAELGMISQKTNVLIMGQGVSGLVLTQVVKLFSPRALAVTDLSGNKLALGRKYGATQT